MTRNTTADSKKRPLRPKPVPKSAQQKEKEKLDAENKKIKQKEAVRVAIDATTKIIKDLADENEFAFNHACHLVHLGGCVFKERRRPTIQNVFRFCSARVEDGRWNIDNDPSKVDAIRIVEQA
ncbi:hypothetical protein BC834DRAFT_848213 [Gloeopeniophorella convolvens]|nr:hypothetical protein BC834DRAFT_848213 [Gloeopeniophorella convolvens]